jgi:hypothetical protein
MDREFYAPVRILLKEFGAGKPDAVVFRSRKEMILTVFVGGDMAEVIVATMKEEAA